MLSREDILNELREISPVLANMPLQNVYTVDPAYFQGIQSELFARISADQFTEQRSFVIPERSFAVPDGYFDGLAGSIIQKIKAAENSSEDIEVVSPVLAGIGNKNVYSVPLDYFGKNAESVLSKLRSGDDESAEEEIKLLSPVLAGTGNRNVYAVPYGYFEGLHFTAVEATSAKVIRMTPARSVFKYAAAAVITGLLGLSVINIVDSQSAGNKLDIAYASPETINTANDILKKGTFDEELNNLSDKEIDQYLQESGQDVKAALVVSSVNDESKLPEADDYLLDENTLNNYLKTNNLSN